LVHGLFARLTRMERRISALGALPHWLTAITKSADEPGTRDEACGVLRSFITASLHAAS
jgi:hypothetical protein